MSTSTLRHHPAEADCARHLRRLAPFEDDYSRHLASRIFRARRERLAHRRAPQPAPLADLSALTDARSAHSDFSVSAFQDFSVCPQPCLALAVITPNIALLLHIRAAVLAYPERVDMGQWWDGLVDADGMIDSPSESCGTTGCLAGWAVALAYPGCRSWYGTHLIHGGYHFSIYEAAVEALGVTEAQAQTLFHASSWPEPFREFYQRADTHCVCGVVGAASFRAEIVADRIAHFIATGE